MPEVIINTWGRIWNFFEGNREYVRRFGTDFEVYPNTDEIAILYWDNKLNSKTEQALSLYSL